MNLSNKIQQYRTAFNDCVRKRGNKIHDTLGDMFTSPVSEVYKVAKNSTPFAQYCFPILEDSLKVGLVGLASEAILSPFCGGSPPRIAILMAGMCYITRLSRDAFDVAILKKGDLMAAVQKQREILENGGTK